MCFVPNIKAFVPKTTFCIRNELKKGEQKFKCNNKRITATISSSLVDHGSIKIIKGKKIGDIASDYLFVKCMRIYK